MRSNSFEITFARVHAHAGRKDGHLIELAGPFEAMVSAFGGVTPDCVTVMVGAPRALAEGRLALWIDLDRATCPRVSDEMVKAIASDKGAFKVGGGGGRLGRGRQRVPLGEGRRLPGVQRRGQGQERLDAEGLAPRRQDDP